MPDRLPTIALCGDSRSGKDCAGAFIGQITSLRYVGSLSWIGRKVAMEALGISTDEEYQATRHQRRMELKDFFDLYRKDDPTRLVRDSLALGEIVVGIRDKVELEAARDERLIDHFIWIENPYVQPDPTVTYTADACDLSIRNNSSLAAFYVELMYWARLYLPQRYHPLNPCPGRT